MSPSSRGLGHRPFTAVTGVRIPVGTPIKDNFVRLSYCSLKNWKQAENKRFSRESLSRQDGKVKRGNGKGNSESKPVLHKILIEQKQSSV